MYFDLLHLMLLLCCLTCVYISIIVFSSVLVYLFWISKRQLTSHYYFKLVTLVLTTPFTVFIIGTHILPILLTWYPTWTSIFASLRFWEWIISSKLPTQCKINFYEFMIDLSSILHFKCFPYNSKSLKCLLFVLLVLSFNFLIRLRFAQIFLRL